MKRFFILVITWAALAGAAAQDSNLLARLEPVPPFPELRAAAVKEGIPLDRFDSAPSNSLSPGASLTALITLHQRGNHRTQWLIYFQVIALSNRPSAHPLKPVVLYNSLGDQFEFKRAPVAFRIRTIGPYVDSASIWGAPVPKENDGRAQVNGTFLSLGLNQGAATIYRLHLAGEQTHATNFNLWISGKPPRPAQARENQKRAAACHLTPEEKTALATFEPTLNSYFSAVSETPDLEGMMWKVVSLPSLWSIVKHGGIDAELGINLTNVAPCSLPDGWNLPASQAYTLPLWVKLNQRPALNATFFVADPRPALEACGGIVGFLAQNPGDAENYLTLRVISTRSGDIKKTK